jgi:hypothetical protein
MYGAAVASKLRTKFQLMSGKFIFCATDLYVVISDTIHKFLRERVDNKRASLTTTTLVHARSTETRSAAGARATLTHSFKSRHTITKGAASCFCDYHAAQTLSIFTFPCTFVCKLAASVRFNHWGM